MCLLCFFYYIHNSTPSAVCQQLFSIIYVIFTLCNICYAWLWLVFICLSFLCCGSTAYSYYLATIVTCRLSCGPVVYICNQIYLALLVCLLCLPCSAGCCRLWSFFRVFLLLESINVNQVAFYFAYRAIMSSILLDSILCVFINDCCCQVVYFTVSQPLNKPYLCNICYAFTVPVLLPACSCCCWHPVLAA